MTLASIYSKFLSRISANLRKTSATTRITNTKIHETKPKRRNETMYTTNKIEKSETNDGSGAGKPHLPWNQFWAEMTTRRFCCLPSASSLDTTGLVSAWPVAVNRSSSSPASLVNHR